MRATFSWSWINFLKRRVNMRRNHVNRYCFLGSFILRSPWRRCSARWSCVRGVAVGDWYVSNVASVGPSPRHPAGVRPTSSSLSTLTRCTRPGTALPVRGSFVTSWTWNLILNRTSLRSNTGRAGPPSAGAAPHPRPRRAQDPILNGYSGLTAPALNSL